jgi:hypothetical protein
MLSWNKMLSVRLELNTLFQNYYIAIFRTALMFSRERAGEQQQAKQI